MFVPSAAIAVSSLLLILKSDSRPPTDQTDPSPNVPKLPVLFHTEHYAVISKPALVPCHHVERQSNRRKNTIRNGSSDDEEDVFPILQRAYATFPNEESIHLVHRLDAPTSGCLMLAFSSGAAREAQEALSKSTKTYYAICRGDGSYLRDQGKIVADGTIKDSQDNQRDACTEIEGLWGSDGPPRRCCLVRARPKTGRWHQIRQHLGRLNHPILCETRHHPDRKENKAWKVHFEDLGYQQRLCLHCSSLEIPFSEDDMYLPQGGICVSCPFPNDMQSIIQLAEWSTFAEEALPELFDAPLELV